MHLVDRAVRMAAHAFWWRDLPEVTVPSALVSDDQVQAWSDESYARDLAADPNTKTHGLLGFVALGGLIAAMFLGCGTAKAAPNVCGALAADPTIATVTVLATGFMQDGLSPADSGAVIAAIVMNQCPQYVPVLRAFVAAYTPSQQVHA